MRSPRLRPAVSLIALTLAFVVADALWLVLGAPIDVWALFNPGLALVEALIHVEYPSASIFPAGEVIVFIAGGLIVTSAWFFSISVILLYEFGVIRDKTLLIYSFTFFWLLIATAVLLSMPWQGFTE